MGGVQSKTQEGSVTQVDFNAATAALEFGSGLGIATSQRVELRLAAKGLPKKDKLRWGEGSTNLAQQPGCRSLLWQFRTAISMR